MNKKTLNYVNMFNHGIREVKSQLAENGNPAPEFKVDYITAFAVEIPVAKDDEPAQNTGLGQELGQVSSQVTAQVSDQVSDQGAKNIVENITESIVENIVVKLSTMRAEIVRIIWRPPQATAETIAKAVNIAPRNVQVHLRKLQEQGVIRRVGPDKGGHWEIIDSR